MDLRSLIYYPFDETFVKTWMNYETSTCTMEITGAVMVLLYTLIFGTWYLRVYKQRHIDPRDELLPINRWYQLRILLLTLIPALSLLKVTFQTKQADGCTIISTITSLIVYPYSICLLKAERREILARKLDSYSYFLRGFWILAFAMENIALVSASNRESPFKWITGRLDRLDAVLCTLRYASSLLLFSLGLLAPDETRSARVSDHSSENDRENIHSIFRRARRGDDSAHRWTNIWYSLKGLAYFIWPKGEVLLQLRLVVCFALVFIGNALIVIKPFFNKQIIDSVTVTPRQFRWGLVVIYVGIDVLQRILSNVQSFLWNRVEEHVTCKAKVEIFRHLHSLSLRWHLERKTGEVLLIVDRGTNALRFLMYYTLFSIFPTIVDTILAVALFIGMFDKWLGLIVLTSMILYFVASVGLNEWRAKIQERQNQSENDQMSRSIDSLLNFETVKCFGAEAYEVECYEKAILESQHVQSLSDLARNLFDIMRVLIDNFGTLAGSLLCLYTIVNNEQLTIGDYVLFTSCIGKLQSPINRLAYTYRYFYENLIDMENLFEVLGEKREVDDLPQAKPLKIEEGRIQFSNVSFSYVPEKAVLKNVSFVVPRGKTIALVGPSGAGKSTVVRLLFRFYDVNEGSILIDGQDIKSVKQDSLRKAIGVVPQDTILFNDTIKYNIHYGKLEASDEQVIAAAKHADIHDRILTFPDAYETEVGERGLRLSGGEKQRVAIARTILKAPKIVLLDEATSALDTRTERNIQAALDRVCANRTTIIVAHRLSTIVHADEILVLQEGEIVERGRHEDLLSQNGIYRGMWEAQFKQEEKVDIEENTA